MKLVRVGMMFALMLAPLALGQQKAPEKVEPPKVGYDVGACSPTDFLVVHLDVLKDDLSLTVVMDGPENIKVLDEPILYKFTSEDKEGKHYFSQADTELVIKFVKDQLPNDSLIGVQKRGGEVHSVIFGIQGDGTKIAANAEAFVNVCRGLRGDKEPSESSDPDPKKQTTEDPSEYDQHFAPGGPIVKI